MTARPEEVIEGSGEEGASKILSSGKQLSAGEQWDLMIPRMGIFAQLRNLRNFDQAGVSAESVKRVQLNLETDEVIHKSRIFPYQLLTAYLNTSSAHWLSSLETALKYSVANIPELPGTTLILIDTSQSMTNQMSAAPGRKMRPGEKKPVRPQCVHAAALFAIATALRNAGRVKLWGFADGQFQVAGIEPGGSVLRLTEAFSHSIGRVGHGTRIEEAVRATYAGEDRVMIFTDEQTFPPPGGWSAGWYGGDYLGRGDAAAAVPKEVPVYAFNLAGYEASAVAADGVSNRHVLGGLTDDTFKLIPRIEAGLSAQWPWEEREGKG